MTPATPRVKETEYSFWREYETPSGVFVEDEESRNYVASAIVRSLDDAEVIDLYTRIDNQDRGNFPTLSTGSASDEVFQSNSPRGHIETESPLVKTAPNQAIRGNASGVYSRPTKSLGGNGTSDYVMTIPGKVQSNRRGELRSDRSTDGSYRTGKDGKTVGVGAKDDGGLQTGSQMEMSLSS